MTDQYMAGTEFVALATRVLEEQGSPAPSFGSNGQQSMRYEDDTVIIVSHFNGLGLEIRRKAQPKSGDSHLHVSNPVTMVGKGGEIIRHHGEHVHVTKHLLALANGLEHRPAP